MKLKKIFTMAVATLAMMASCQSDDDMSQLSEVQVSSSYVSLPAEGGQASVDVNAKGAWTISLSLDKDTLPEWLTVAPSTGGAGTTTVMFSADAATSTNSTTLYLTCNNQSQRINVLQQTEKVELPMSTCAEVIAGANSDTYRVKGTVTKIANTTYGNWYLNDGTGEIYIYGTLDAGGAEKNFTSLGIEAGDIVEVQGPKTTYGTTIELVNVTVLSITKSLIKVDSLSVESLPKEGGEFTAYLTNKGEGVDVVIPEDAQQWLSVTGVKTSGTATEVKFKAAANEGGARSTTLSFTTTSGGKEYSSTSEVSQEGSIIECSIAEFNAAEEGSTLYRLSGVITSVKNDQYGNFYIKDYSGETYVYGMGSKGDFAAKGLKVGDIVTVVGVRTSYNGTPQTKNVTLEDSKSVEAVTVAEFLTKEDSNDKYYMLSGTVGNIKSTTYGNYDLTDETGTVYIYGTLAGWNGPSKQFESLGVGDGDKVTLITVKASYKDTPQGKNAILFSKE